MKIGWTYQSHHHTHRPLNPWVARPPAMPFPWRRSSTKLIPPDLGFPRRIAVIWFYGLFLYKKLAIMLELAGARGQEWPRSPR
jgi:hypothetical protein